MTFLTQINTHLRFRTFLVGYSLTLADFTVWATLKKLSCVEDTVNKYKRTHIPCFSRWWHFLEGFVEFQVVGQSLVQTPKTVSSIRSDWKADEMLSKWRAKVKLFLEDPTQTELVSPPAISGAERKVIHTVAEELGITSVSKGEGKHRLVIVTKAPRVTDEISTVSLRKFQDDFNLKINMCETKDFMYFVKLYGAEEKFKIFEDMVRKHGNEEFPKLYQQLVVDITNKILATDAFQKFMSNNHDVKEFEIVRDNPLLVNDVLDVYQHSNNGEYFISLDLRSANFNSLKWLDPKIVLDQESWQNLLALFTNEDYFFHSKALRQKVFWLLSPKKINRLSKYITFQIYKAIEDIFPNMKVLINTDELIIKVPADKVRHYCTQCTDRIENDPRFDSMRSFIRLEAFRLSSLSSSLPYFVREIFDSECKRVVQADLKGIPKEHFAVVWKHYYHLPLEDRDRKLAWDKEKNDFLTFETSELNLVHPLWPSLPPFVHPYLPY
eukprot:TRINITY_DN874_c0_g1_i1.p1 TRINITY_DN874_c0_g1~~TRINITY_DN874_c0_g1_i1.p1  ORF type:complete len:495 (-),score=86.24 TRINITY_DN874_c0_g1_i1:17-1501(-)